MGEINFDVLDRLLNSIIESDFVPYNTKQDLIKFIETHDPNSLSEESCFNMIGIYKITIQPAYEEVTGKYLPNIFIRRD